MLGGVSLLLISDWGIEGASDFAQGFQHAAKRVRLGEMLEDQTHPLLLETARQLSEYFAGTRQQSLTGFAGGLHAKETLLTLEGISLSSDREAHKTGHARRRAVHIDTAQGSLF